MKSNQGGFTLVEIAIVLVIIGLLLGGVLKGQELINSAKVKSMVGDFRTTSALVFGYQDRFKRFPGDQTQIQLDDSFGVGQATACTPGAGCAPGNGRVDGNWNDGAASETFVFWQHVRRANLATGSTNLADANYMQRNADGGQVGVESGINAVGVAAPWIANMTGSLFVCSDGILGRYVRQIDSTMDDGNTAGGSVQAVPMNSARGTAAIPTANIVEGQQYTVCASL
jgi:prepilin-type N-terminal cleavage/methylation domain-containing protein